MAKKLPSKEIQHALLDLIDAARQEDRTVRERQLRRWKKLKFLWEGFHRIWWDSVAHDWRVWDLQNFNNASGTGDSTYYDKPVNIFRAFLDSIIAALSISVPGISCTPDDADSPSDLETANAADKIAELIDKHNDADLIWLRALFVYVTEGLTFAYNYNDENESYGTYKKPQYEDTEISQQQRICPICQTNIASPDTSDEFRDEFDPDDDDVPVQDLLANGQDYCPNCLMQVDPTISDIKMVVPRLVDYINKPKARQCIKVFGGLNVKVPNYARNQTECPYLCLSEELHYTYIIKEYCKDDEELADIIRASKGSSMGSDPYERWARISTQYLGEYPADTPTLHKWWLRPEYFEGCTDKRIRTELKKKYPSGVKVVLCNEELLEICNEALDDHWTATKSPVSDYIHHEPLGESLVSAQEITNEIISLVLQTIEHGIPQTFFNPDVLDSEAYKQVEASPGMMIPTKSQGGRKIEEGFYTVKTASLSTEVFEFSDQIQTLAQMVSGALPSIYGGNQPNSSKTASQYSMSRAQALQRLQTTWKILTVWWKELHGKVIPAFIKNMAEDEKYVDKDERGNFLNVYIRKSELDGKIGSIELEAADQLPVSWAQKKDAIMAILSSQNPAVQAIAAAPENIEIIKQAIAVPDLVIPGEDQREYQFEEIKQMISGAPVMADAPNPMGPNMPPIQQQKSSLPINPFDDNQIHAEICKEWLVSIAGRLCKVENAPGYTNVLLHWQAHNQAVQQAQMQAMIQQEMMNQSRVSEPSKPAGSQEQPPIAGQVPKNAVAQ